MPLPTVETPKYETKIPSSGKKVTYRPYLVKEEKILMIAMESENQSQILSAVKDIIKSCTFGKVDPDKLSTFDLEFLFLKLRAKSVGEVSKVGLRCEKCNKPTDVEINLDGIGIDMSEVPANRIQLTEKIGVTMNWPKLDTVNSITDDAKNSVDSAMQVIASCIETIFDDKKVYPAEEQTKEELVQFIESLSQVQFAKIQDFLAKTPRLEHVIEFDCANKDCAHHNSLTLVGLQSFFG